MDKYQAREFGHFLGLMIGFVMFAAVLAFVLTTFYPDTESEWDCVKYGKCCYAENSRHIACSPACEGPIIKSECVVKTRGFYNANKEVVSNGI